MARSAVSVDIHGARQRAQRADAAVCAIRGWISRRALAARSCRWRYPPWGIRRARVRSRRRGRLRAVQRNVRPAERGARVRRRRLRRVCGRTFGTGWALSARCEVRGTQQRADQQARREGAARRRRRRGHGIGRLYLPKVGTISNELAVRDTAQSRFGQGFGHDVADADQLLGGRSTRQEPRAVSSATAFRCDGWAFGCDDLPRDVAGAPEGAALLDRPRPREAGCEHHQDPDEALGEVRVPER